MNWKVIKTEAEHKTAVKRAMEIFHAEPDTPEDDKLGVLLVLIKDFEDKYYPMPELDALEVIKIKMQKMGLKNKDLEPLIGTKGHVSAVLSCKREITLKMAQKQKTTSIFQPKYFCIRRNLYTTSTTFIKNTLIYKRKWKHL